VNALRGRPPEDCSWSTHDVAELARTAAALANAYVAVTLPGADEFDYERLRDAANAWRAVRADTIVQGAQMIAWRDNPDSFPQGDRQ
jgi:hypothetical protein